MTTSDWLKPAVFGATGGAARRRQGMADAGVVAALVPLCLDRAAADPGRDARMTAIRAATGTRQRDAVMAMGWATPPGSGAPGRDLAMACLAAMDRAGA